MRTGAPGTSPLNICHWHEFVCIYGVCVGLSPSYRVNIISPFDVTSNPRNCTCFCTPEAQIAAKMIVLNHWLGTGVSGEEAVFPVLLAHKHLAVDACFLLSKHSRVSRIFRMV